MMHSYVVQQVFMLRKLTNSHGYKGRTRGLKEEGKEALLFV